MKFLEETGRERLSTAKGNKGPAPSGVSKGENRYSCLWGSQGGEQRLEKILLSGFRMCAGCKAFQEALRRLVLHSMLEEHDKALMCSPEGIEPEMGGGQKKRQLRMLIPQPRQEAITLQF